MGKRLSGSYALVKKNFRNQGYISNRNTFYQDNESAIWLESSECTQWKIKTHKFQVFFHQGHTTKGKFWVGTLCNRENDRELF